MQHRYSFGRYVFGITTGCTAQLRAWNFKSGNRDYVGFQVLGIAFGLVRSN